MEDKSIIDIGKVIIDLTLRVTAYENLMLKKGIISKDELQEEIENVGAQINKALIETLKDQDSNNKREDE